jgi:glycosyltransferase involved in cell wall biosynthesis
LQRFRNEQLIAREKILGVHGREEEVLRPPRFSIVITFHNQRGFITEALGSALSQGNKDCEVIGVDDASTDGSQDILKQYSESIRLVCLEKNVGACAARNRGAALATGEYLIFLDGDDAFLPWALKIYEQIVNAKKPKMILASMRWFEGTMPPAGETPREIGMVEYQDYFRRDRGFGHSASAFIIDRQAFEDVHGWLEGFFPLEDVELALRLGVAGRTIQILYPPTVHHRAHAHNSVNNVLPFLPALETVFQGERQGNYPGGKKRQFQRRALLGGVALHWIRRAAKARLRRQAAKLFIHSSPMLLAAAMRRVGILLRGRQPRETIKTID